MKWVAIPKLDKDRLPIYDSGGRKLVERHALQSECKRYTLARVFLSGQLFYEAWRGKEMIVRDQDRWKVDGFVDSHAKNQPA